MKKFILLTALLLISFSTGYTQPKKMNEELKKIRKQKYIENVTSVDEATADKYFEVFDANFESIMKLNRQRKETLEYIEKNLEASDLSTKMEDLLDLESKILDKKKDLYTQLKTFLSPKQLAQSMIFQVKFNKELKKQIDKRKRKDKPEDR
jgi:Zn-dependent M32 family carboxypeptidase